MFYSTGTATSDCWIHRKAGAVRINWWLTAVSFTLCICFCWGVPLVCACLCVFCQAHCIMSVTGEQRLFITESGQLCGVITWKEVIRAACIRTNMYTHTSIYKPNNDEYTGHTDYMYLLQKGWSYDTWFYLQMKKIIEEMAKEVWSMDNQLRHQNSGQSSMCAFHF